VRKRPSRFGYWFGGAIAVLSVAGAIAFFVVGTIRTNAAVEAFPRVPVASQAVIELDAGEQVVFTWSRTGPGVVPPATSP